MVSISDYNHLITEDSSLFSRIYLKRKAQKSLTEYICLFVIMAISMVLINIPGVFIDSINKGEEADYFAKTGGYDVIIEGAKKDDMHYFEEVAGITYTLHDGRIYIKISDSVDKEYTVNHISYINNANDLNLEVRSYMISKTAPRELIALMNGVKVLFTVVGMISIYFAYTLNFQKRRSEIRTLIRFGISRKDLFVTLILELVVIFISALLVAILISNLSVYLIIKIFFTASDYYTQIIYSYDILCFMSLFICSLSAAGVAFYLSWRKIVSGLFGDYFEKEKHHSRFINEGINDKLISPEKFIVSVNLFREVEYSVPRGIVAFITVIMVTFAVQLNGMISNDYYDYDILVKADISQIYDRADEINAAYDKLTALQNLSRVDTDIDYNGFVSDVSSKNKKYSVYSVIENQEYIHISLTLYDGSEKLGSNEALVSENTDMEIFSGNLLKLYAIHDMEHSVSKPDPEAELKVIGKASGKNSGDFLDVFVSGETFVELTGYHPVPRIFYITLDEKCDTENVAEEIHQIFKDESLFTISDYYIIKAEQKNNDRVIRAIIMLMAISMAVCGFLLTYVFSSLIGLKNITVNRQMISFGVPQNCLINSAAILALIRSMVVCACGIGISLAMALVVSYASGVRLSLTLITALMNTLLIVAMFLAHIIPEIFYIKKQTRLEE